MVGVVEVKRGDRFGFADKRVEVAEHRRRGGKRVHGKGLHSVLEFHRSQRVSRHAGIHHGEAVFAQLGGDTFTLGIIVLSVALRGDDKVRRGVERGVLRHIIYCPRAVDAAPVPRPRQLVVSLAYIFYFEHYTRLFFVILKFPMSVVTEFLAYVIPIISFYTKTRCQFFT